MGDEGGAGDTESVQPRRGRMRGFTLIELMITIAVLAIILAIAIPNVEIWMVRARIQSAAGRLQQDINWAKGYAIRSGYPVSISIQGSSNACAWTISPQTFSTTLQNVPQMSAPQYTNQYRNTPCTVVVGTAPTATAFSVTPTGMVYDATGTVTSAAITFQATSSQPATYGYWQVEVGGAGDVRSCATASAQSTQCNLQ
ncbi:Tfp pilus assembly protein FimT-like protein [Acidithiobacillus ferrivorans]|uniref:Type II secretion system protein H n=1 Tax=Acidithiobacillus ferrivorans TaxID=160808 RepID=A0A060UL86_9PROT|nr:GspH/FimT family pseudopilin [Acidithiobacillus ferrivorans]CDQ09111.1 Tfp pilus assembly protein FimT-like protein [Acidithiobacillus ferrivorans]SMH64008.1 Tfp pilus assembly protein FimT-like protein [Acidithiobacillus ferrivorans]